ncbi:hypothetical protein BDY19DRAFT_50768 [Irpex rosettiformis]|uniref:Uncharacterized protein n=1 Tax=Irpex rosettiformis TaxID=378272 RepID=A0ACB8UKC6_9APHY|nr:hypothetical protein BDY19DRAFT_50768 [Irpex rosettiformis]
MPNTPPSTSRPPYRVWLGRVADHLHKYPDDHPIQIALRTYVLGLFLSLGPPVITFAISSRVRKKGLQSLLRAFKRELNVTGFAFAMTVAVGGGAALQKIWQLSAADDLSLGLITLPKCVPCVTFNRTKEWLSKLKGSHKTFLSYAASASVAITLLQYPTVRSPRWKGRPSATLDLSLLLLVRAIDSIVRSKVLPSPSEASTKEEKDKARTKRQRQSMTLDAFVFWACSARIMWCFFYEPERLPHSYNKWIMSIANIDPRILGALRAIRSGGWSYIRRFSSQPDMVTSLSHDIGYPPIWGDISRIPAYGGPSAQATWEELGVKTRSGLGGLPCELVHGGVVGSSCIANAWVRGVYAFAEALALYLPVHILPILLTRPRKLLRVSELLNTLLNVLRSASFLSTFVSSIWITVCLTRTLLLARLMPWISHDFWDGPFGCTFAGSLACGASIWIEKGQRRGEMSLYVLPRAIRACLSDRFLKMGKGVRLCERAAFVLSFATLMTAAWHGQDSLRGLSRWTLAFIINGPNAGFWKQKRQDTRPSTPNIPPPSRPCSEQ